MDNKDGSDIGTGCAVAAFRYACYSEYSGTYPDPVVDGPPFFMPYAIFVAASVIIQQVSGTFII